MIHDRDSILTGWKVKRMLHNLGIEDRLTAKSSPWQNRYAERVIGTLRRECTDHVIPMGEKHLLKTLCEYVEYYNESRTHSSLGGDSPRGRSVEAFGDVIETPVLGGLHHRYSRVA